MDNKIKAFLIFVLCITLIPCVNATDYTLTLKAKLIYEINDIRFSTSGIVIEGWAFVTESQHFVDTSTYKGEIILRSSKEELHYPINFIEKDMTYIMKLQGVKKCGENEYKQKGSSCFYEYKNVGFQLVIPFSDLSIDNEYNMTIGIETMLSKEAYKTYIIVSDISLSKKLSDRTVVIQSDINQTSFYVNQDYVYARKAANKYAQVIQNTGNSCSTTYGTNVYFDYSSPYNNVYEVTRLDDITWFRVKGDLKGCKNSKNIILEGTTYDAWIPSTFVEYTGVISNIKVKKNPKKPILEIENPTIYVGDTSFNPDDYVQAYDEIDGEISFKQLKNTIDIFTPGRYMVIYSAKNSNNLSTSGIEYVTVI